jgi:hypothetical protein
MAAVLSSLSGCDKAIARRHAVAFCVSIACDRLATVVVSARVSVGDLVRVHVLRWPSDSRACRGSGSLGAPASRDSEKAVQMTWRHVVGSAVHVWSMSFDSMCGST